MANKRIETNRAPAAIGPYCQAVAVGEWVYCSGQLALDPDNAQMVGDGDIEAETRQVLQNLEAVLEKARASRSDVVKATVYLTDMNEFSKMKSGLCRVLRGAGAASARDRTSCSATQGREGRDRLRPLESPANR